MREVNPKVYAQLDPPDRPAPTREQALAAADRICQRRIDHHDPDQAQLPDDLPGIVRYVFTYRQVPEEVLEQDIHDGLTIWRWLSRDLEQLEYGLMRMGINKLRWGWPKLARVWNLNGKQAAYQAYLRAEAGAHGYARIAGQWRAKLKRAAARAEALTGPYERAQAAAAMLLRARPQLGEQFEEDLRHLAELSTEDPVRQHVLLAKVRRLLREILEANAGDEVLRAYIRGAYDELADRPAITEVAS
jgi:hypothetical protein